MHDLLDDYAHSNGLRETSTRLKLLLGGGSILLSVLSSSPLAPIMIAICMSCMILGPAHIPWRIYSRLLMIPLSFTLISSAVVALIQGSGEPAFHIQAWALLLQPRWDGISLGMLLLARTVGGMCSLFFIALTTPMIEIFSLLKALRLPESLIELSMLIYRFIFVLLEEASMIHQAQEVRLGNTSLSRSISSYAMLSSVLFVRAWERGERLVVAMDSRAYDGRLEMLESDAIVSGRQLFIAFGYLTAMAALTLLGNEMAVL